MLDPNVPAAAATTGDNWRDNVEQVHIDHPVTGLYSVVVSHKNTLSNEVQEASILISGNQPQNVDILFTDVTPDSESVRLEWNGAVGSIYRILSNSDLLNTNDWNAVTDEISIIREQTTWTDSQNTNRMEQTRFYRIEEVK